MTEAAKDFAERATIVRALPPIAFAESLTAEPPGGLRRLARPSPERA